jgi:hypothetical protein
VRRSGVGIFFALVTIACGPFGLSSAFVALNLWSWFAAPLLHVAAPTFLQMYCVFAVIGFVRSARYVKDGRFDWKDAIISSVLNPGLLLVAGYLVHVFSRGF